MKDKALDYLRLALDTPVADFRLGQWECIEALLAGKSPFLLQRTGGKTMLYLLGTNLLCVQVSGTNWLKPAAR